MVTSLVEVLPFNWAPEHYLGWRLIRCQDQVLWAWTVGTPGCIPLTVYIVTTWFGSRFYIHTFLLQRLYPSKILKTLDPLKSFKHILRFLLIPPFVWLKWRFYSPKSSPLAPAVTFSGEFLFTAVFAKKLPPDDLFGQLRWGQPTSLGSATRGWLASHDTPTPKVEQFAPWQVTLAAPKAGYA